MNLLILGCGTIIPRSDCAYCSGYLLNERILIDCGPGIWHAICKVSISIPALDYILISHFHVDHTADLGALLLSRYLQKESVRNELHLIGPVGTDNWFKDYKRLLGEWISDLRIDIQEVSVPVQLPDYQVFTARTEHTRNSICFRITHNQGGKVVFYSGDSGFHENLIKLADGADLAILESSCSDSSPMPGHLTPGLAADIARKAGVKKLLLTHRYPVVTDVEALSIAGKRFDGPVELATDGMKISI